MSGPTQAQMPAAFFMFCGRSSILLTCSTTLGWSAQHAAGFKQGISSIESRAEPPSIQFGMAERPFAKQTHYRISDGAMTYSHVQQPTLTLR